jgi:hypothetical protein
MGQKSWMSASSPNDSDASDVDSSSSVRIVDPSPALQSSQKVDMNSAIHPVQMWLSVPHVSDFEDEDDIPPLPAWHDQFKRRRV